MAGKCKEITILIMKIGKRIIKNIFFIPEGTCKFEPVCSVYAEQAIRKYSLLKAIFLIIMRIIRCNPFSKGGYDPIK
jgi:putative membrane protein insertion efficiency factor